MLHFWLAYLYHNLMSWLDPIKWKLLNKPNCLDQFYVREFLHCKWKMPLKMLKMLVRIFTTQLKTSHSCVSSVMVDTITMTKCNIVIQIKVITSITQSDEREICPDPSFLHGTVTSVGCNWQKIYQMMILYKHETSDPPSVAIYNF